MFDETHGRFASYNVVATLPDEAIDHIWYIIDNDLQGIFPLPNLIHFNLVNSNDHLSYDYLQKNELVATFDSPFPYANNFPKSIVVYDSGEQQLIATPNEVNIE